MAICFVTAGSGSPFSSHRKLDNMCIGEGPTPVPDSEIGGSEACRDLTLRNANTTPLAGNAQRRRQENEPQCGFLFGCTGDLVFEGGLSGLPVLLFSDEEAGSRTRGKQCGEWSRYPALGPPPSFLLAWLEASR